jgi:hypothetical protein
VSTTDQRPPTTGHVPLLEPRPELSQSFSPDPYHVSDRRTNRTLNGRPLSLRNMTNNTSAPEYPYLERAHTISPSQRSQSMHGTASHPYSSLRSEGVSEETTTSPKTDRLLPSFHQLSKIADGGTEVSDSRTTGLPTIPAYTGQVVAQTATTSLPYFSPSQQSSPSTNFMFPGYMSPPNSRNDAHEMYAPSHSPAPFPAPISYNPRRKSVGNSRPPLFHPSMTTSSIGTTSSSETMASLQSHHSSEIGGYSTTHTTPMESPSSLDNTPKPSCNLTRSQTSTSIPAGFLCDYPGCGAPPFQTQYLLK